nr:NADH dehydrogenase subunit 7, mitochondrial [Tanacetum cinerariifolium]
VTRGYVPSGVICFGKRIFSLVSYSSVPLLRYLDIATFGMCCSVDTSGMVLGLSHDVQGGNTFSLPDNKFTLWVGKWKSRCKKVKSCCEEDFFQSFPTEHFPAQDRVRILPLPLVCCRLQRREKRHSTRGTEKLIEYKTYLQALPYSDRSEGDRPTKPTTPCSSLSALAGESLRIQSWLLNDKQPLDIFSNLGS